MQPGSYCICIRVLDDIAIRVGALETLSFPSGRYIYVGSALNGLKQRIKHHISTNQGKFNTVHWHIDYLLLAPETKIEDIYIKESDEHEECQITSEISIRGYPIWHFGCSDCECYSHLIWVVDFSFLPEIGMKKMFFKDLID